FAFSRAQYPAVKTEQLEAVPRRRVVTGCDLHLARVLQSPEGQTARRRRRDPFIVAGTTGFNQFTTAAAAQQAASGSAAPTLITRGRLGVRCQRRREGSCRFDCQPLSNNPPDSRNADDQAILVRHSLPPCIDDLRHSRQTPLSCQGWKSR